MQFVTLLDVGIAHVIRSVNLIVLLVSYVLILSLCLFVFRFIKNNSTYAIVVSLCAGIVGSCIYGLYFYLNWWPAISTSGGPTAISLAFGFAMYATVALGISSLIISWSMISTYQFFSTQNKTQMIKINFMLALVIYVLIFYYIVHLVNFFNFYSQMTGKSIL